MSVAFVNNEAQLYDIFNITGFVCNVSPIEIVEKNEQQISLRKASLKDHTDETFCGNLAEKDGEQTTFFLTDLQVSKYINTRLLKTTETSTATVSPEICYDTENVTDSNRKEVTGYNLSVDFDTLKQKLMSSKRKCIVDSDEIVICSSSNTMTTLDCCKKKSDIVFSVQVGTSKLILSVQPDILVVTFGVPLDGKFKLAKCMVKVEVKIRYSLVDNKVITLEKVHI